MKKILIIVVLQLFFGRSFSQGPLPPAPPTNLSGAQIDLTNSLNLAWNASGSSTVAGYKIFYNIIGTNTIESKKVGLLTSSTLENLSKNVNYKIYLRSFRLNLLDTLYSQKSDSINVLIVDLNAPKPSAYSNNITHNSIGIVIDDTNLFETGFQAEIEGGGQLFLRDLNVTGSNVYLPVTPLTPKTIYSFRVRARINSKFGPWSSKIYATTLKDFPPAPILNIDQSCPTQVHFKWTIANREDDIENFIVQKSYDNLNFIELGKPNSSTRDFYDYTSEPGKAQFYRVFSYNSTGVNQSNVASIVSKSYQAPNPAIFPISLQTNKSNNHLTIQWTNGLEDLECKTNIRQEIVVRVRLNNSGEFVDYVRGYPFIQSIKIDKLKPKTIVEVGILSISDKGIASSMVVVKDTTAGPPYSPTNPIAVFYYDNLENAAFDINWQDNSKDEDYFTLERSLDNKTFQILGKIKFNQNKLIDLNLEEGVFYYYRVKAGSVTEGESDYSPTIGPFFVPYSKTPNAPYGLKAKQNGAKVDLKWYDDSIREENYIIEKSLDDGLTYSLVATLGKNVTTYTDENVTGGKTYIFKVKAVNPIGTSAYSNLEKIKISGTGLIEDKLNANVYPNPAFESLNIETANLKVDRELTLKVYDRNNRQVLTKIFKSTGTDLFELPISNLGQGMYNVVITDGETSISKKVFKY